MNLKLVLILLGLLRMTLTVILPDKARSKLPTFNVVATTWSLCQVVIRSWYQFHLNTHRAIVANLAKTWNFYKIILCYLAGIFDDFCIAFGFAVRLFAYPYESYGKGNRSASHLSESTRSLNYRKAIRGALFFKIELFIASACFAPWALGCFRDVSGNQMHNLFLTANLFLIYVSCFELGLFALGQHTFVDRCMFVYKHCFTNYRAMYEIDTRTFLDYLGYSFLPMIIMAAAVFYSKLYSEWAHFGLAIPIQQGMVALQMSTSTIPILGMGNSWGQILVLLVNVPIPTLAYMIFMPYCNRCWTAVCNSLFSIVFSIIWNTVGRMDRRMAQLLCVPYRMLCLAFHSIPGIFVMKLLYDIFSAEIAPKGADPALNCLIALAQFLVFAGIAWLNKRTTMTMLTLITTAAKIAVNMIIIVTFTVGFVLFAFVGFINPLWNGPVAIAADFVFNILTAVRDYFDQRYEHVESVYRRTHRFKNADQTKDLGAMSRFTKFLQCRFFGCGRVCDKDTVLLSGDLYKLANDLHAASVKLFTGVKAYTVLMHTAWWGENTPLSTVEQDILVTGGKHKLFASKLIFFQKERSYGYIAGSLDTMLAFLRAFFYASSIPVLQLLQQAKSCWASLTMPDMPQAISRGVCRALCRISILHKTICNIYGVFAFAFGLPAANFSKAIPFGCRVSELRNIIPVSYSIWDLEDSAGSIADAKAHYFANSSAWAWIPSVFMFRLHARPASAPGQYEPADMPPTRADPTEDYHMLVTPESHRKNIENIRKVIGQGGYTYSGKPTDFTTWIQKFNMLIETEEIRDIVGGAWKQPSTNAHLVSRPVAGVGMVHQVPNPNDDPAITEGNEQVRSAARQVELWRQMHKDYTTTIIMCIDNTTEPGKQAIQAIVRGFEDDKTEETEYIAGRAAQPARGRAAGIPATVESGHCAPYAARALKRLELFGATTNSFTTEHHRAALKSAMQFRPGKQSVTAWQTSVTQKFTELRKHDESMMTDDDLTRDLVLSIYSTQHKDAILRGIHGDADLLSQFRMFQESAMTKAKNSRDPTHADFGKYTSQNFWTEMHELAARNNFENTPVQNPNKRTRFSDDGGGGGGSSDGKTIQNATPVANGKGKAQLYFSDGSTKVVERNSLPEDQQKQVKAFFSSNGKGPAKPKTGGKGGGRGRGSGKQKATPHKQAKDTIPDGMCKNCWRAGKHGVAWSKEHQDECPYSKRNLAAKASGGGGSSSGGGASASEKYAEAYSSFAEHTNKAANALAAIHKADQVRQQAAAMANILGLPGAPAAAQQGGAQAWPGLANMQPPPGIQPFQQPGPPGGLNPFGMMMQVSLLATLGIPDFENYMCKGVTADKYKNAVNFLQNAQAPPNRQKYNFLLVDSGANRH